MNDKEINEKRQKEIKLSKIFELNGFNKNVDKLQEAIIKLEPI